MIWLKHFLGLCKPPLEYDLFLWKISHSKPGRFIELTDEEFHWCMKHDNSGR